MVPKSFILTSGQNLAIWVVYLVAAGICAVSALSIFQTMMHAFRVDTNLEFGLVFSAAVFCAAAILLEGTRKRRDWAIWPALALLLAIVPVNCAALLDYTLNPNLPPAGFATEQDVANRGGSVLRALVHPTESEFWRNRTKTILTTALALAIVALPTPILWSLRKNGVLQ